MARFIFEGQGHRGPASRLGTKESGIYTHTRGWDIGAHVSLDAVNNGDGFKEDVLTVRITSGSNNWKGSVTVARLKESQLETLFHEVAKKDHQNRFCPVCAVMMGEETKVNKTGTEPNVLDRFARCVGKGGDK